MPSNPVLEAMRDISQRFVPVAEIQQVVHARLAELTNNEGVYVTSGAAAAMYLATIGAVSLHHGHLIEQIAARCRQIRQRIEAELGIPASAVMGSCSHTHSGPMLPPWRPEGMPAPDEAYVATLTDQIVQCVVESSRSPVAVSVGHGSKTTDVAVNRRLPFDRGRISYPPHADPDGPVDRKVGVLRFDDKSGETVAVLFSYGCHPTVGGTSSWIGPDFPGAARAAVEAEFPSAMAAFILGNCGDVRSNYTNPDGTFRWDTSTQMVDDAGWEVGSVAAEAARAASARPTSVLRTGRSVGTSTPRTTR